jgi:hypothetical protein
MNSDANTFSPPALTQPKHEAAKRNFSEDWDDLDTSNLQQSVDPLASLRLNLTGNKNNILQAWVDVDEEDFDQGKTDQSNMLLIPGRNHNLKPDEENLKTLQSSPHFHNATIISDLEEPLPHAFLKEVAEALIAEDMDEGKD